MENNEGRMQESEVEVVKRAIAAQKEQDALEQQQAEEEMNDTRYFIRLFEHLKTIVQNGKRTLMGHKIIVDQDDLLTILGDMEANMPDAIQYGMQLFSEKERILKAVSDDTAKKLSTTTNLADKLTAAARAEADRITEEAEADREAILNDAEERAAHMVSEDEIVRRARDEARTIRNDARVEAGEIRLKANHDAYRLLSEVEAKMEETLKQVHRLRAEAANKGE